MEEKQAEKKIRCRTSEIQYRQLLEVGKRTLAASIRPYCFKRSSNFRKSLSIRAEASAIKTALSNKIMELYEFINELRNVHQNINALRH